MAICMSWLAQRRSLRTWSPHVLVHAACEGHFEAIKWLHSQQCQWLAEQPWPLEAPPGAGLAAGPRCT